MADEPGYRLSMGAEVRGGTLVIAPTVAAPAGKALRYELVTQKSGRSGNSNTRQSGSITADVEGKAALSRVSVSLAEGERCQVTVRVYEGSRLVASQDYRHPR